MHQRAGCQGYKGIILEKPALERNQDIVLAVEVLIACPWEMKISDNGRGGTWYTMRRAREAGRALIVCWPDGTLTHEPPRRMHS